MTATAATRKTPVLGSADLASAPRTLVDVLRATGQQHPDAAAIDDGTQVLTYRELIACVESLALALTERGVGRGDRVGIRLPSGAHVLYVAILAALFAGAAYVPVDADDPPQRAELVFGEAEVHIVLDDEAEVLAAASGAHGVVPGPAPTDDAWVIFTSGSTGVPKGVAVSHRNAAAFVDAEARLFLADAPLGPGDRVLAGLSVAFDASCEEMWLAWRSGACLVPAPRSLVRSGVDLGTWLVDQRITVVSTVPTLAALWPQESLDAVRLLIFGGEACPQELSDRLTDEGREVWNTYGPTEATVVACAAPLREGEPVRIGLPLDGWALVVVDADEQPVKPGREGQLVIGGAGLARYLDPEKDAQKYAPLLSLGWDRAYRSGDLVRLEPEGLAFVGRVDDQVKVGGRRIELGEVDAALLALDGVVAAAAAVRSSPAGAPLLVGYVVPADAAGFDRTSALRQLRRALPAALVPTLAVVDDIPTRTSGKVDRDALPWPFAVDLGDAPEHGLSGVTAWLAEVWTSVLGMPVTGPDDDFFAHGGGSLTAAQLVSLVRARYPEITVGDVYKHPRIADLGAHLERSTPAGVTAIRRVVRPMSRVSQLLQLVVTALVATVKGLQWLTVLAIANNLLHRGNAPFWAPPISWWVVLGATLVLLLPFGRMVLAALVARLLLIGVGPGDHPRGGQVHLRLWAAERFADTVGAVNLAGAPWIALYARALGARVGRGVDLHTVPPITGLLSLGAGCVIEPEVDLSGYWLDGDVLRLGRIEVDKGAGVGARSTLGPGARIGRNAQVEAGSFVSGEVPAGQLWVGSPAEPLGAAGEGWPTTSPPRGRRWLTVYGVTSLLFSLFPVIAALPALALLYAVAADAPTLPALAARALAVAPLVAVVWFVGLALLFLVSIRLLGIGVRPGVHAVRSRVGWQVWAVERLMDAARTLLFPIYSSLLTPWWLRALGTQVGRGVEASTVLLQPRMTTIGDGAFLADDTMIGSYELHGGWLRIEPSRVGNRAFLGNSGMAGPGRTVPKDGLVAVLSAAPLKAKKGSSWIGSPPARLRRSADAADVARTFAPRRRIRLARAAVEACRIVPLALTGVLAVGAAVAMEAVVASAGYWIAALTGGLVLLAGGVCAAIVTIAAKWLIVGRLRVDEHPLWSSFVWRNEVVDAFVEMVAAPWFAHAASGTAALNAFLRALGAQIGRGVWCETYWLPEPDLVRLGDGVSVNRGCVVQTHLFHDRIMRMDRVELADGSTLGPHCVILPAASLGRGTVIGPASLVMRGEAVPAGTRWIGNPIGPWATAETSGDSPGMTLP